MDKSVRSIFMALIGTIVLIVISSIMIEFVNISVNGIQLQQITNMACKKSLVLFAQESYKDRGFTDVNGASLVGGSVNMDDIKDETGEIYVEGKFYNGSTVEDIYKDLYTKSDFKEWADSSDIKWDDNGKMMTWYSISLLNDYINNNASAFPVKSLPEATVENISNGSYDKLLEQYTSYLIAKSYVETFMTPLNFGVPYMDEDTVNKMFKWNLTKLTSNCHEELIKNDNGEQYVQVHGFRIYAKDAFVTNIKYQVFDTTKPDEAAKFRAMTNIDSQKLGFTGSDVNYLGTEDDERSSICVISVEYSVPISYVGISPLKNIFEFVWNQEVEGWDGIDYGNRDYREFDTNTQNMTGGGYKSSYTGALPVPGKLIYYVVR